MATVVSFVAWLFERMTPIPFEAIVILAIVVLNGILGFVQENRAEQAVAALQAMVSPTARVLRAEGTQAVPAGEIVPGDVLLLEEGDTVAADARVIESIVMRAAEAALTGESTPVGKSTAAIAAEVGIGDRENMVFSGTAVASGRGPGGGGGDGGRDRAGEDRGPAPRAPRPSRRRSSASSSMSASCSGSR